MSTDHFTSDLHLDSRLSKPILARGFDHWVTHMTTITRNWRMTVKPQDRVWILGDIATGKDEFALEVLSGLPGEKHLILGNHDSGHPMHRSAHNRQKWYQSVFASVSTAGRRRIGGQEVLLSHFPYTRDHTQPPRHMQWRLPDCGAWLLHGHIHSADRVVGREIHVGIDAWDYIPVSLSTIEKLIANTPATAESMLKQ